MKNSKIGFLYKKVDIPLNNRIKIVSEYGKVDSPLKKNEFKKRLNQIKLKTLYVKEEILNVISDININCSDIIDKVDVFVNKYEKIFKLEDYKQIQSTSMNNMNGTLTEMWVEKLIHIITDKLETIGKGWFNLFESNKESYEFSKLKKLLTRIKYMMQDTIFKFANRSLNEFVTNIELLLPEKIELISSIEVKNVWNRFENVEEKITIEYPSPLFVVELLENKEHEKFY